MNHHHLTSHLATRSLLAIALACSLATQTRAQSPPPDLAAQLAALETKLTDPEIETKSRADLAKDADDLRARLVALQPTDHRVATWLTDRAAFQLNLAAATGLDLVCIFGLPTPAQADQVRPFAQAALDLSKQADTAAASAITTLEARLLDRANPPAPAALAEIESRLAMLVETEQAKRIPMLRALARTLLASTTADPERAATIAQDAVRDLKDIPAPTPALKRALQTARGAALVHAAFGEHAQSFSDMAHVQFRDIDLATPPADPDTALRARLGLARTGTTNPPIQARTQVACLEAEAAAAYLVGESARDLTRRRQLISDAVRLLFASAPTEQEVAAGAADTRARICEKIAAILPKTIPIASLPPEAAFARAVTLARTLKTEDAQGRDSIVSLLTLAADNAEASGSLRCAARWERAVVLARATDEFAAFDALARVFTEDAACAQALDAARRTAETFIAKNPPGKTPPPGWSLRRGVFRAALLLLLQREPEDRWRAEYIRLVAVELPASAAGASGLPDDFARASATIETITSDAVRAGTRTALADALVLHLDRRRAEAIAAQPAGPAWNALNPAARAALSWSRIHDAPRTPLYTLLVGESLAYSDDRAALAILAPLAGTPFDQPDSPLFIRYRFALSRAQRLNNELAKAFTTLHEAADRLEGAPGTKSRDPAFWAAWAEMLAILQSMNAEGSRTEDLRVQIKRLELLDPTLGGPPHAEAIKRVRDSVGR